MHLKALFARWNGLTLSTQIIIGLLVGVFIGVFFGQEATRLEVIAEGYIRLMQMTVIPYITVALIVGCGGADQLVSGRWFGHEGHDRGRST